jgi:hypothetical protein
MLNSKWCNCIDLNGLIVWMGCLRCSGFPWLAFLAGRPILILLESALVGIQSPTLSIQCGNLSIYCSSMFWYWKVGTPLSHLSCNCIVHQSACVERAQCLGWGRLGLHISPVCSELPSSHVLTRVSAGLEQGLSPVQLCQGRWASSSPPLPPPLLSYILDSRPSSTRALS